MNRASVSYATASSSLIYVLFKVLNKKAVGGGGKKKYWRNGSNLLLTINPHVQEAPWAQAQENEENYMRTHHNQFAQNQ